MQVNYAEKVDEHHRPLDWPEIIDAASREQLVQQYASLIK
jgi:hypothetical protein